MGPMVATAAVQVPWGASALTVLVLVLAYAAACAFWPWTACGHCEGGKKRSPSGKNWRDCRRCKGRGKKVRLGRRVWTSLAGSSK